MIESAIGFRWNLIVQDENGRQTQPESQITRWFRNVNTLYFYSKPGFCEHVLALKEETRLDLYGYDGIKITNGLESVIISNIGGNASGGLLHDLLVSLAQPVSVDNKSGPSNNNTIDYSIDYSLLPSDQVTRFLESFLNKRL